MVSCRRSVFSACPLFCLFLLSFSSCCHAPLRNELVQDATKLKRHNTFIKCLHEANDGLDTLTQWCQMWADGISRPHHSRCLEAVPNHPAEQTSTVVRPIRSTHHCTLRGPRQDRRERDHFGSPRSPQASYRTQTRRRWTQRESPVAAERIRAAAVTPNDHIFIPASTLPAPLDPSSSTPFTQAFSREIRRYSSTSCVHGRLPGQRTSGIEITFSMCGIPQALPLPLEWCFALFGWPCCHPTSLWCWCCFSPHSSFWVVVLLPSSFDAV